MKKKVILITAICLVVIAVVTVVVCLNVIGKNGTDNENPKAPIQPTTETEEEKAEEGPKEITYQEFVTYLESSEQIVALKQQYGFSGTITELYPEEYLSKIVKITEGDAVCFSITYSIEEEEETHTFTIEEMTQAILAFLMRAKSSAALASMQGIASLFDTIYLDGEMSLSDWIKELFPNDYIYFGISDASKWDLTGKQINEQTDFSLYFHNDSTDPVYGVLKIQNGAVTSQSAKTLETRPEDWHDYPSED